MCCIPNPNPNEPDPFQPIEVKRALVWIGTSMWQEFGVCPGCLGTSNGHIVGVDCWLEKLSREASPGDVVPTDLQAWLKMWRPDLCQ